MSYWLIFLIGFWFAIGLRRRETLGAEFCVGLVMIATAATLFVSLLIGLFTVLAQ